MGCYIWYSEDGTGRGRSTPTPLLAVPNITAYPSTASLLIKLMPVGLASSADAASETGPNMKFAHVCKPAYVRIREKTVGGVAI